ncbi:hypothetical protein BgiBS90_030786 [Biomphalaria glabrata]|nr:hypothetical protein BgiBS90_030786 [Biomphalaria glabrata]
MDDQYKGCLTVSSKRYIYIVVLLLEHWGSTGVTSCLFPEELRGSWVSSKKGDVLFTDQTLSSFYPCRHFEDCGDVTSNWTCTQNIGHKYVMMSDLITAESLTGRIFTCLYLYKMTSTKFLMYQGPTEEKGLPYYDYVKVALVPKNLTADQLCDLDESAFPPSRHNLLIRNGKMHHF